MVTGWATGSHQPEQLPEPSLFTTLNMMKPDHYVDAKVRLVSFGLRQTADQMGPKTVLRGLVEDRTFRAPILSHKLDMELEKNGVYLIRSAYVYQFPDESLSLILTEFSRVMRKNEDPTRYVWRPTVAGITRPIWDVTLEGVVTRIFSSSGLVRRCNTCRQVFYESCPKGCSQGWSWDLRISCLLTDHTGSIRTVFARHLAARLLGRSVPEILYAASSPDKRGNNPDAITYVLKLPEDFEAVEATVENSSRLRSAERLLVTDGFNLVYVPDDGDHYLDDLSGLSPRKLDWRDPHDARVLRKFIEKALDIRLTQLTGRPATSGLHLVEDPLNLYGCEKAKLYTGFTTQVRLRDDMVLIDVHPQASILENLWEYVNWRRNRGASANAIQRTLLERRALVHLAPFGRMGRIREAIWRRAGETPTSESDERSLVEFWREAYNITVQEEETPLLRVQPADTDLLFTYPPSTAYLNESTLPLRPGLGRLLENKKRSAAQKARAITQKALTDLKLGSKELQAEQTSSTPDPRHELYSEVQHKLYGKRLRLQGQVIKFQDTLYFLPNSLTEAH